MNYEELRKGWKLENEHVRHSREIKQILGDIQRGCLCMPYSKDLNEYQVFMDIEAENAHTAQQEIHGQKGRMNVNGCVNGCQPLLVTFTPTGGTF